METMQKDSDLDVSANGAVIGSVEMEKSDKDEKKELLQDVESALDVKVKDKKPKKTCKPKTPVAPTRRSKRLQEQDDVLTGKILGNLHSTNGTKTDLHSTSDDLPSPTYWD